MRYKKSLSYQVFISSSVPNIWITFLKCPSWHILQPCFSRSPGQITMVTWLPQSCFTDAHSLFSDAITADVTLIFHEQKREAFLWHKRQCSASLRSAFMFRPVGDIAYFECLTFDGAVMDSNRQQVDGSIPPVMEYLAEVWANYWPNPWCQSEISNCRLNISSTLPSLICWEYLDRPCISIHKTYIWSTCIWWSHSTGNGSKYKNKHFTQILYYCT